MKGSVWYGTEQTCWLAALYHRFAALPKHVMERFLHFDNLDIKLPEIASQCSQCGQEFYALPKQGEKITDVVARVREEFDVHVCRG